MADRSAVTKIHDKVYDFIVVGGGIAGVSCAEYLTCLQQEATICLISSSDLIKAVRNVRKIARTLEQFDVVEKPLRALSTECSNVTVVKAAVTQLDGTGHKVIASDKEYCYKKLCICSGARPKLIAKENEHVLGLRDTESVKYFKKRLSTARRVIIIGNGGIALELAYDLNECEVIWVIKDDSIGNAYLDKGAAMFFLQDHELGSCIDGERLAYPEATNAQTSYQENVNPGKGEYGSALGQRWKAGIKMVRCRKNEPKMNVHLEYNSEVKAILTPQEYSSLARHSATSYKENLTWNVYVELTNGRTYGCDFIVSATGVVPNSEPFVNCSKLKVATNGGLEVDDRMRTNIDSVYAAGDVCNAAWEHSQCWMQMRLWTQANQMGAYAAKCMVADASGDEIFMDFCFELFTHVTQFFGYKVILLGKYNGQGLGKDYNVLLRCTKGKEYIKVVVHQGKVHGALLIGETDFEETLENLILNQLDVSDFQEHLLDPNIDIEDYFD